MFAKGSVRSSASLHESALGRVFSSPIGWFEVTPAGRTLNRFGRDMDMVDTMLPPHVESFCVWVCEIVGIIAVVAAVAPLALAPSAVALLVMLRMNRRMQPAMLESMLLSEHLAP